jgi:hypothetical protein
MYYLIKSALLAIFIALGCFTWLQLDDPDAFFWVIIYGIAAMVPLLGLFGKVYLPFSLLAGILCLTELIINIPGYYTYWLHHHEEALMQSMSAEKPYIEEAREFLGSLIALLLVASSHLLGKRTIKRD